MAQKITISEMERRVKVRFPNESFKILEFDGLKKPGKVQCLQCNSIIEINHFENFLTQTKKYGCKNCQSPYILNQKELLIKIKERYDILNIEVQNTYQYLTVQCKQCGHIRMTYLKNLEKKLECGCKTGYVRNRTGQEFINEVNKYSVQGLYELVGEYINQSQKVLIRHDCGFIFEVHPYDITHGRSRCPRCRKKRSKYELFIEDYLKEKGINFYVEKQLTNFLQRFDFYLENDRHKIAIEYNGAQHYKETDFFSNSLEDYQSRDRKKELYCKENNIKLYIIPYWLTDNKIRAMLDDIINEFND